jgi:hypothetical protein
LSFGTRVRIASARAIWALTLGTAGLLLLAACLSFVRARGVSDPHSWQIWYGTHWPLLLAWRLCVYGATAYGWMWMRRRIQHREPAPETHRRLLRTEIAALLVVLAIELIELWHAR